MNFQHSILSVRNRHIFMLDIVALLVIPALAFTLRLDNLSWWPAYGRASILFTCIGLVVKLAVFHQFGLYRRYWCFASMNDIVRVVGAIGISTAMLAAIVFVSKTSLTSYALAVPRTIPIIDGLLSVLIFGGFRVGLRGLYQWQRQGQNSGADRRVLIVGAGELGTIVVREIRANPQLEMEAVGFVDDDRTKVNTIIESLPVVGTVTDIPDLVNQLQIEQVILATATAPLERQRQIVKQCKDCSVATLSLPAVYELVAGYKSISPFPKVDVNRLLNREPVQIDQSEVASIVNGATVLVTGAGGSIGSELCRQIAHLEPTELILLGHGENSIFEIGLELRLNFPELKMRSLIVDVRDGEQMNGVVERYRPQVIFHAAAHKHVHFMEHNVAEAVTNNVLGTQNVLRAAEQHHVERLVMISTDKAVNPSSIMGATKRLAELLVQATAHRTGRAYMAVRFGNVLGSRGSVIPVFQRQIAAGGPLTLTHPDMCRYFMTIPEAVQLVLQAAVLGRGGEVFLLDMGEPVRILDLAAGLIKLSGLEPGRDIEIVHSGIRPGEKLSEELFLAGEDYRRTDHEKIFVADIGGETDSYALDQGIIELERLARDLEPQAAIQHMHDIVVRFRPKVTPPKSTEHFTVPQSNPISAKPTPAIA